MSDEPGDALDQGIRHLVETTYHVPPDTPREEIWQALESRLAGAAPLQLDEGGGPGAELRRPLRDRWPTWAGRAVAASVLLALGVGLGRVTAPSADTPAAASVEDAGAFGGESALRHAASRHLEASEALLAFVQSDARAGRFDGDVGRWGKDLLLETRLLLDSDAGRDPVLRELLLDLEVILAQVAVLDGTEASDRGREELRLIARGVDDQAMMARIQSVLPTVIVGSSGT